MPQVIKVGPYIEANVDEIHSKWLDYFDEISYYC